MSNVNDIVIPENLDTWQLTNPTPEEQIAYFDEHDKVQMPHKMWDKFYCVSLEHRGFHCSSCTGEEEYTGVANFDDRCCCLSEVKP
jgi:hypothetical protein